MVEKKYITYHIPDASGGVRVKMRELFNENHDPETGQFAEGGGSGGGGGSSGGGPSAKEVAVREAIKKNPYHSSHHIEGEGTITNIMGKDLIVKDNETAAEAYKRVTGKDLTPDQATANQESLVWQRAKDAKIDAIPTPVPKPVTPSSPREIVGYKEVDADGYKVKVPVYKDYTESEKSAIYDKMEESDRQRRYNDKIHSGALPGNFPYEKFK